MNYNQLINILKQELGVQKSILELLKDEKEAVVSSKSELLDAIKVKKEDALLTARTLEEKRKDLFAGGKLKKLSDLINECQETSLASELAALRDELKEVGTKVQEQNLYNGKLIKETLGLVASTLAIFRSVPGDELPTYSSSGSVKEEKRSKKTLIDKV